MKKKDVNIFALWDKDAREKTTSTPNVNSIQIESNESNMQLALVPTYNDGDAPQFVPAENDDEPNGEGPQPNSGTEVPQLPIEDETTADEEGDGEVRANLEALDHDHGKRIPISRYDVNDRNKVAGDILRRVQFNQRIMILNT